MKISSKINTGDERIPHKMNIFRLFNAAIFMGIFVPSMAQLPSVFSTKNTLLVRSTSLTRKFLTAERIVWTSDPSEKHVQNTENILKLGIGQADLNKGKYLTLISDTV